jgi:hypothetical protein
MPLLSFAEQLADFDVRRVRKDCGQPSYSVKPCEPLPSASIAHFRSRRPQFPNSAPEPEGLHPEAASGLTNNHGGQSE